MAGEEGAGRGGIIEKWGGGAKRGGRGKGDRIGAKTGSSVVRKGGERDGGMKKEKNIYMYREGKRQQIKTELATDKDKIRAHCLARS